MQRFPALAAGVQQGVFRRGYVSGTLAVHLHGKHVSSQPGALRAARSPNALIMRPMIKKAIEQNKEAMRGVYEELAAHGIFSQA